MDLGTKLVQLLVQWQPHKNFKAIINIGIVTYELLISYMERTAETSTGGPPSIVLIISKITGAGSPLYN